MSQQAQEKIEAIVSEYSISDKNNHVGSGKEGNVLHLGYLLSKENRLSSDVKDLSIEPNVINWNPDFLLNSSKKDVRELLDTKINEAIGDFSFPVDQLGVVNWDLVDGRVKDLNVDSLQANLQDLNPTSQFALCLRITARFSQYVDAGELNKYGKQYTASMETFPFPMVAFSLRTQVGLERIVSKSLDESADLAPIFSKMEKMFVK
jgi:hypothetical protein